MDLKGATAQVDIDEPEISFSDVASHDSSVAPLGILSRAELFARRADLLAEEGDSPYAISFDRVLGPVEAELRGKRVLLFGTNSYLGLNFHPSCVRASIEATQTFGTGSTASRVAGGTSAMCHALEAELRDFFGRSHAVVFSTGFMANLGVISAIAGRGDAIFLDADCHASIIDAAKLSGAHVRVFRHNDAADLARLFERSRVPGARVLVVVEGAYSVVGDTGNLKELLPLAKRYGAVTMVDEAHALGLYGTLGRGVAEAEGVEPFADIIVGTFSKCVGVIGGFCTTNVPQLRHLPLMSRPFLFTASLPPGVLAAARAALGVIRCEPSLRMRLEQNVERMRTSLRRAGIEMSGCGPIGRIQLDAGSAERVWRELVEKGLYTNLLVPPATRDGEAVIRISLSAAHSDAHIDTAVEILRATLAHAA